MKAMLLERPGPLASGPLRAGEVPDPTPGSDEIVVRVHACGVCRSNLHMIEGDWVAHGVPTFVPIIPGHEVVGSVESVGADVTGLHTGDRVGVQPIWSTCGVCEYCLGGAEQRCQAKQITGESVHGGYAELMLAKAAYAYPLPDVLDYIAAASLFCPGITAYGAVTKADLSPARSVAVFGVGGVGHVAIQFARLTGARTIAVTRAAQRRSLAEELGADRVVDASGGDAGTVLARDGGVDAALVFAPSDAVVRQAIEATKPGGIIVLGVNADIGTFAFADEKRVVGSLLGTRQMMHEVLQIAAAGRVRVSATAYPLDDTAKALRQLADGQVRGRLVLVP